MDQPNLGPSADATRLLNESIKKYGNSGPFISPDLHKEIVAQWKATKDQDPLLSPIFSAESCAFGTTGFSFVGPRCQRGSYFGTSGTDFDGRDPVEFPVKTDISDKTVDYWMKRVEAVEPPRLKAHYADLIWEYSEGRKISDAHSYAMRAADEYLNAYAEDPKMRYRCADRAIHLASTVNDQSAVQRAVKLILDRLQGSAATPEPSQAAFNLLINRKCVTLSPAQESLIIQRLDEALCTSQAANADPQLCIGAVQAYMPAADCLIGYFNRSGNQEKVLEVLRKLVKHHLSDFAGAGPLAPPLLAKLRKKILEYTGDKSLLQEVDNALRDAGVKSMQTMAEVRTETAIPTVQVEAVLNRLCQGTLRQALHGFAMEFTPDPAEFRGTHAFDLMRNVCPMIMVDAQGRRVGDPTVNEDSEMCHLMVCAILATSQLLVYVLGRILIHYQAIAETVAQELSSREVFEDDRRGVLEKGIECALSTEHLVAGHLLIPQIEHAVRRLVEGNQHSTYQPTQRGGGTPLKLLNALLDEPSLSSLLGNRYLTYLKVVLTEEMGLNLRNRLCHGMMVPEEFTPWTSAILVHVLAILGLGRAEDFKTFREGMKGQ
jgi:hypothetical protein